MTMKSMIYFIMFILINNVSFAKVNCTHDMLNFRCVEYVKNYDGDTITFNIPGIHPLLGKKINIRLRGVDTPEIKTKNTCEKDQSKVAKKLVATLLTNSKKIDLTNIERGKYFRVVADVIVDGKSLAQELMKSGLAYSYDGGTKTKVNWCNSIRDIASKNKRK